MPARSRSRMSSRSPTAKATSGWCSGGDGDHRGREVEAVGGDGVDAAQVGGDVAGAAADVEDAAAAADVLGEGGEQGAVEGLVVEFVGEAADVLVGDGVPGHAGTVARRAAGDKLTGT
jgi:hypothetical protein